MMYLIPFCLLAVICLVGSYYAYRIAFFSPANDRDRIPSTKGPQYDPYREDMARIFHQLNDRPCEFVTVTSHDGLVLSGRYYHIQDGAPLDIGFHGYKSSYVTDFSGGSELSFQLGHNVLLVDQRAHGKSGGRTIAFGIQERQDVLKWIEYAVKRFGPDVKILLYGISMGGATVLMVSELPLPPNVKGIIADCPYAAPIEIILHVGKKLPWPGWLMRPFILWGAKIFGGFDLTETDARKAVKSTPVPILIIHGESDSFVPQEMSDIAGQNPSMVIRHTFPRADHGISYLVDTKRYHAVVTDFINKVI